MELPHIPQDDLMDVQELTERIENQINIILKDNEINIAISSLMGATINCMLSQCQTLDEVVLYRNLFMQILDNSIRTIQIQGPQKPPAS